MTAPTMTDCLACGPDLLRWIDADPPLRDAWSRLARRRVARGAALHAAGVPARSVWWVEHGLLRSFFLDAAGQERNRAFHAEGQWAGGPPSPRGLPADVAIEALEASVVVELPHAELQRWQAVHPVVQGALLDAQAAQVATLSHREAALLMDSATERYQRFLRDEPALARRLPLVQVASYLGITNVALSRIRRRLADRRPA